MDKLVYGYYLILLFILLLGAKVYKNKSWNNQFMSLSQTKSLQGFFAICILLCHAGHKTCSRWVKTEYVMHGLDIFIPMGYLFVAFFLFCSGYGLYKSYKTKEDYLRNFLIKRVLPFVFAFYSSVLIYFIVRILMGEQMTISQMIYYLSGAKLCNPNSWFMIALTLFYLSFYFSFKLIKNDDIALFVTISFIFIYTCIGLYVGYNDWWFKGEWWYNCVHLFSIGLLFSKFEDKIVKHLKKFYHMYMIISIVICICLLQISEINVEKFAYFGESISKLEKVNRGIKILLPQMGCSLAFVLFICLLNMKIRFGNVILKFMGTLTLEFYLIHGLYIELFGFNFLDFAPSLFYVRNVALYVLVVIIFSIPSAILLKRINNVILKKFLK